MSIVNKTKRSLMNVLPYMYAYTTSQQDQASLMSVLPYMYEYSQQDQAIIDECPTIYV